MLQNFVLGVLDPTELSQKPWEVLLSHVLMALKEIKRLVQVTKPGRGEAMDGTQTHLIPGPPASSLHF